eukprot:19178-Heterococcus_DN1.PRE.2
MHSSSVCPISMRACDISCRKRSTLIAAAAAAVAAASTVCACNTDTRSAYEHFSSGTLHLASCRALAIVM